MAMAYEVWDTETFNRVDSFPTAVEAEAFLGDVRRENGATVAAEMAIVGYPDDGTGPVMVLEGARFLEQCGVTV